VTRTPSAMAPMASANASDTPRFGSLETCTTFFPTGGHPQADIAPTVVRRPPASGGQTLRPAPKVRSRRSTPRSVRLPCTPMVTEDESFRSEQCFPTLLQHTLRRNVPNKEDHVEVEKSGDESITAETLVDAELRRLREEVERLRSSHAAVEAVRRQERRRLGETLFKQMCRASELEGALETEKRRRESLAREFQRRAFRAACSETSSGCNSTASSESAGSDFQDQDLVARIVAIEVEAFEGKSKDERERIRRRLLMKWHPDRNEHSSELSTKILQEMQAHPSW